MFNLRELFVIPADTPLPITSSDYLRIRGVAPAVRVMIHDEIERLGVEQLLRSRGAKILADDRPSSKSKHQLTHVHAELIVIASNNDCGIRRGLVEQIESVSSLAPNARLLIICPTHYQPLAQAALQRARMSGEILVRTDSAFAESVLQASRRVLFNISRTKAAGPPLNVVGGVISAMSALQLLTRREYQLLELVALGDSNKKIASNLGLSLRTVNSHIGMVFTKLRVSGDQNSSARVIACIAFHSHSGTFTQVPGASDQRIDDVEKPVSPYPVYTPVRGKIAA